MLKQYNKPFHWLSCYTSIKRILILIYTHTHTLAITNSSPYSVLTQSRTTKNKTNKPTTSGYKLELKLIKTCTYLLVWVCVFVGVNIVGGCYCFVFCFSFLFAFLAGCYFFVLFTCQRPFSPVCMDVCMHVCMLSVFICCCFVAVYVCRVSSIH